MIGYINNVRDRDYKVCTAEKFAELTQLERTRVLTEQYRSGANPDAKGHLPALLFMGYNPSVLQGKEGKRAKNNLKPTGLVMLDFDHVENPAGLYQTLLRTLPEMGLDLERDVALVHITPSGKGLRVVLQAENVMPCGPIRSEDDIAAKQQYVAAKLGTDYDAKTKDLSRLSFCPQERDVLYMNGELLFTASPPNPLPEKEEASLPRPLSPKGERGAETSSASPYYKRIVDELITLYGGEPQVGNRNNMVFMLASDLCKITDYQQEWLEQLIPTFGLPEEEWRATIAAQCKKTQDRGLSRKLKEAIRLASAPTNAAGDPPALPAKLPSLIALLTSRVLPHQRPAVASMVFPALAVHVNNCLFRLADNTSVELSLMCCLLAPQSVGKGCVKPVLREIMADIRAEDRGNRIRERQWQEQQKNRKANEKGQSKPEGLVIRCLSSDTTPAAFLGRLFAAEAGDGTTPNLCTYSQVDEIEDLYRFCASGGRNMVQQMIKRTWDRDDIGAERFTANAANIMTVLRWNWAASSTIEGGKSFFKHCLTDGTTSRVDFCTIIQPGTVINFRYGDYDAEFRNALRPYIDRLTAYACEKDEDGQVVPAEFPEIRSIEDRMTDYINATASGMPDSTWENYAWRTKVMAVKKLIVLYLANGCQWEEAFEEFAWWSFHYSMWCKLNLFYDEASRQFQDEQLHGCRGNRSPLKAMHQHFTYTEFAAQCQQMELRQQPNVIIRKYKQRGIVVQQQDGTFLINPEWAKRNGIV